MNWVIPDILFENINVYIRVIRKKASVDKPLLEYMTKKLNTR